MAHAAAHILVSGIVQGVGYRYWTERTARQLGLHGWVRNLDDGRVEIYVEGEPHRIRALIEQAKTGPRSAEVSDVSIRAVDTPAGAHAFEIRRTASAPDAALD